MKFFTSLMRRVSVRGLVLLGFFMALLPLLMGLFSSILAVEDLAAQSQKVVYHVAEEAQNSQELLEKLNELELKGKHYLLMRDSGSFKEYRLNHEQFGERLRKLMDSVKPGQDHIVEVLEDLAKNEKAIFDSVVSQYPPLQSSFARLAAQQSGQMGVGGEKLPLQTVDGFQGIKARAGDLAFQYSAHVDQEARDLEALSFGVKYRLIVQAAMLLPISLVLLTIFVYVLHQPLRQMDHVIRTLGAGNFTHPIRV
ncbi:MAG: hypothetical protein PHE55_21685, partial [Methylococcaceae bacterium]|nr:hypothetical protein [Methylococcaceae bacterium]